MRFGYYSLYDEEIFINKDKRKCLHVICECGAIEFKRKDHLETGRCISCKSCASKRTAKNFPPPINRKGCEELSGTFFLHLKYSAVKRDYSFDLSPEYLWGLFQKQNGKCAITGLDIVMTSKIKNHNPDWGNITASLDRIDSSKSYEEGNVWWVHKTVNRLKNNYSMEELVYWSQLIVNKHGNIEPSALNDITVSAKVQRLEGEESI